MLIIIGLGNPGEKYSRTRHNAGFRVLDEFQKENNFPKFKLAKKNNSLISEGKIANKKILLVKPQTFMNNSGLAVKSLTTHYSLLTKNLTVVHDDIDLPLGKIKIIKNRGSAGHKGVESIIKELRTKGFVRFRIGIKKIHDLGFKIQDVKAEEFVLKNFTKDEEKIVKDVIKTTCSALKTAIKEGLEKSMTKFN